MKAAIDSFIYMYVLGYAPSAEFSAILSYLCAIDNLFIAYLYHDEI